MKTKYIKATKLFSFFITFLITAIFFIISYNFFISNFKTLEKGQNIKNIHTVLDIMNKEISSIESIVKDYAHWDDTYMFLEDKNKSYIYENFRDGTNTLEELNIDFFIFTDLNNKSIFSKYINLDIYKNQKVFQLDILKHFEEEKSIANIYKSKTKITKVNSNYFYIVKIPINNSDNTEISNGYLYGGKIINNEILNSLTKVFDEANFKNKQYLNNELTINSEYLKNTKINIEENSDCNCLINNIQLYDNFNEYIISIETKLKRNLIEKGKETILGFNLIITIFIFFISFLIYKNQRILENYNEQLTTDIKQKTIHLTEANNRLRQLSQEDELTKIHNRRHFFTLGDNSFKKCIKTKSNFCVVMLDIDDFKKVNDTYGHNVGDQVLISFTKQVLQFLSEKNIFGRLGGEEFAIIFENHTQEKTYDITEKIRKSIADSNILCDKQEIHYTVSFGLSQRNKEESLDELLQNADKLLYKAKDSGKNCIIRDRNI